VTAIVIVLLAIAAIVGIVLFVRTEHELDVARAAKAKLRNRCDVLVAEVAHLQQRVRELEGEGLTVPFTWTLGHNEEQTR
jgi:hypothetical protein